MFILIRYLFVKCQSYRKQEIKKKTTTNFKKSVFCCVLLSSSNNQQMDSLVCDLTNALNSNSNSILMSNKKNLKLNETITKTKKLVKNTNKSKLESNLANLKKHKKMNHTINSVSSSMRPPSNSLLNNHQHHHHRVRRHNSLNSFRSSSSSSLNLSRSRTLSKLNKHNKIMNLLLAARASINQIQSNEKSNMNMSTQYDSDIHNLVRIKQPITTKSQNLSTSQIESQLKKKSIKSKRLRDTKKYYKIQKIYRFHSNYRLHCIRLRRLQKKMRHNQQNNIQNINFNNGTNLNKNDLNSSYNNQEKMNLSNSSSSNNSTITTSTTHSSYTSTSDLESSSLDEFSEMENLNLNSENETDSNNIVKLKQKIKPKTNKKLCSNKRRLLTYRQRRQLTTNQSNVQLSLNLNLTKKNLFQNFINEKACKLQTSASQLATSTHSFLNNSQNLDSSKRPNCFKRKRINCNYSRPGNFKKLSIKPSNEDDVDSSSIRTEYEESNEDKDPIESDLDTEEAKHSSSNLSQLEKSYINIGKSREEEADDEQSSDIVLSDSSFKNVSEIEVVPWWTNTDSLETCLNDSSSTTLSNYQKLNFNFNKNDENEFNDILTGAFNLMTHSSKISLISKDKSSYHRKKRYNNLSNDSCYIATKSSSNLNQLITAPEPVNSEPIPETNIGNKMLKNMGWRPGTSLGSIKTQANPNSLKEPIVALKRPKRVGLGFGSTSLNETK